MPTLAEKLAYARKLLQIERRFGLLERDTLSRSIVMMRNFRGWIAAQLTEIDNFEQFRLRELQANIEQLILQYEGQLRALSNGAVRGAFNLGRLSVIEPLESAGITNLFFRPSPAQVNVLLDFSADLIRGISEDMRKYINTQISLAALGGKSPFQTMKDITKKLDIPAKPSDPTKGISYQAERILRTEMNRAYSLASFSQQRELAEQVPGLKKQWRATGDARTRFSHLMAHGQIVLVNEPFVVGGEKLMYPLDPAASARNTVNCRCVSNTIIPEIGPIRSPLDDKIEAERARREKEKEPKAKVASALAVLSDTVPSFSTYDDGAQWSLDNRPLDKDENAALARYTTKTSTDLNQYLRHRDDIYQMDDLFLEKQAGHISSALKKLPVYNGIVYRGVDFKGLGNRWYLDEMIGLKKSGNPLYLPEFTSTTARRELAEKFASKEAGAIFEIVHRNGKIIDPYSRWKKYREREVLFDRDSAFMILDVIEESGKHPVIILEELVGG